MKSIGEEPLIREKRLARNTAGMLHQLGIPGIDSRSLSRKDYQQGKKEVVQPEGKERAYGRQNLHADV